MGLGVTAQMAGHFPFNISTTFNLTMFEFPKPLSHTQTHRQTKGISKSSYISFSSSSFNQYLLLYSIIKIVPIDTINPTPAKYP